MLPTLSGKRFVPVEVEDKKPLPNPDEIFDAARHRSHLKYCEKRAADWREPFCEDEVMGKIVRRAGTVLRTRNK